MNSSGQAEQPTAGEDRTRVVRRMSRRGFACAGALALAGLGGWRWVVTRSDDDGLPWPLRRALEGNERLGRALFRESGLAPTFPPRRAREPRVNGDIGLNSALDSDAWRLNVTGPGGAPRVLTLADVKRLPRVEMITELKCIEGWSQIVQWAGAPLADLVRETGLAVRSGGRSLVEYVSITTPDEAYYVGLDMASALHPQTLLCYEMNGQPLTASHGAPLRLAIPLKYGIKNLKRIGTIQFTDERPADYWAERGYDWYSGH